MRWHRAIFPLTALCSGAMSYNVVSLVSRGRLWRIYLISSMTLCSALETPWCRRIDYFWTYRSRSNRTSLIPPSPLARDSSNLTQSIEKAGLTRYCGLPWKRACKWLAILLQLNWNNGLTPQMYFVIHCYMVLMSTGRGQVGDDHHDWLSWMSYPSDAWLEEQPSSKSLLRASASAWQEASLDRLRATMSLK